MQAKIVAMQEEPKTMLVTGGAGFIGSEFIRYTFLKHPNYQIINLDKLTYAGDLFRLTKIASNPKLNYKFVEGDITDAGFVTQLFNQYDFDYVVNFAAETHVTRSIFNPAPFMHTNIEGVRTLLNAAFHIWKEPAENGKRFLHISTDEVYGSLEKDDYTFFTEEMLPRPRSPYSASKAEADLVAQSYFSAHNIPVLITRSTNNYGPWQHPEKLIPLVVSNALEDKKGKPIPIPIHGDGRDIRDWLYVGDHCAAIDTVLHYGKPGEIYNIGSNNEVETIEIVEKILDVLNKPHSLIKFIPFRENHDMRYAIDASKIKNDLHWEPKVSFDEGMEFTIKWYSGSLSWLQKLKSTSDFRNYYQKLVAGTDAEEAEEIIVSSADINDYAVEAAGL
jgi:dTDP-glucose 4,6-dehydratase